MKVSEVIQEYQELRKRPMPTGTLLRIINATEERIKTEIIDHCADAEDYTFTGYTIEDLEEELLAPAPYDRIYVWACCYKHDLRENQVQNASNSYSIMEDIYKKLSSWWIRNHEPKRRQLSDPWHNV